MKYGNWIPLSKALVKELPTNRPFSKVEAAYSIQVDFDNNHWVSVAGYAKRWGWGRKKVMTFLREIGVCIDYPENTEFKQNQKGQIGVQKGNRNRTDREQINFINNKDLSDRTNRSGVDQETIRNRSGDTTIKTSNTKTDIKTVNPGFSQAFIEEHWVRWTRLRKGGAYNNAEIESIALEELYILSTGNESIAAQGLKTAITAQAQSFQWCFRNIDNVQSSSHDRTNSYQNSNQENNGQFGADNVQWLELHARKSSAEAWPKSH